MLDALHLVESDVLAAHTAFARTASSMLDQANLGPVGLCIPRSDIHPMRVVPLLSPYHCLDLQNQCFKQPTRDGRDWARQ